MTNRSTTEQLAAALVAAFPQFVEGKLAALGVEPDTEVVYAAEAGCISLGHALNELVHASLPMQSESPLQLVRMATKPLAEALAATGVPVPMRDGSAVEIHPEDVYDLYPASPSELGEEVWQLHVQWGLEKARVVAGMVPAPPAETVSGGRRLPAVAIFGLGQDRREAIAAAIGPLGYETLAWRNPAALDAGLPTRPALVLVDLDHPNAHDAIRAVADGGLRAIAVGEHVNDFATAAVMTLGAETAIDLDRLVERLPGLLPRLV